MPRGAPTPLISLVSLRHVKHAKTATVFCTNPPHDWKLDDNSYGTCAKCGAKRQYPRPGFGNFRVNGSIEE